MLFLQVKNIGDFFALIFHLAFCISDIFKFWVGFVARPFFLSRSRMLREAQNEIVIQMLGFFSIIRDKILHFPFHVTLGGKDMDASLQL